MTKRQQTYPRRHAPRRMTYAEQELKGIDLSRNAQIVRLETFREEASLFIHQLIEEVAALEAKIYSLPPNATVVYEDDHIRIIVCPKIR